MVNGMADGEPKKSGGEGIGVCPKHFVPCVLTPVMGEFGVMVEGGCHFFFSDQGPLLKGSGGDVGGKYPGERVFDFVARFCWSYFKTTLARIAYLAVRLKVLSPV